MRRDQVLSIVKLHREQLQQLGVDSLEIFGSVARDEAKSNSDVDFLVKFTEKGGLFQLFQVQHYLEEVLGCAVDLGTHDALREHLREPVTRDVIRVF
ncbi:DNA polymerase beta domain protein region [Gloeocapsa sp. PCC 7428]|uniref:nucleotidyltransferase family protein n=1 Tax=Gloeocapsa sp. PCC 7428 TaxID=1173026 RepID=UPI0002A60931|nr:nucleotidyltransferase [Gloeocapsa sp. PCC 7428]AFZ28683.1 DNA polymerase beta domain protein region [Gloeocapsa sp. PCC 7428]